MSPTYAWIIDLDHTHPANTSGDEGTTGPRDASTLLLEVLRTDLTDGNPFRLYDDDGILYYEGRIIGEYDGFEPLEDFGTPNAGCTGIKYGPRWEYL